MNPYIITGVLAVLAIGLALLLTNRRGGEILSNIAEGAHGGGLITKLTDAALATRHVVVKFGTDADHIAVAIANSARPLGICTDEASAAELPVKVALFGQIEGTLKITLGGTVAAGDELTATTGGVGLKLPTSTGTYYPFGVALQAGVSGDTIEFAHYVPIARAVA